MNLLVAFRLRTARLAWPATLLVLMLQRTPVLRVLASAEFSFGPRTGEILRALIPIAATIGAVDTLTGATQPTTSPSSPISGRVGDALAISFAITGTQTPAQSWAIDGALPAGVSVPNASVNGTQRTLNATSGFISGIPTQSGTFNVSITAYEFTNRTGNVSTPLDITINIAAAANSAPSFTQQPQSLTVDPGAGATFTVAASGSPAPTFQWRKDNSPIAGQTSATLTINSVQAGDAGTYDCVATNAAGSATSSAATLTVNLPAAPTISSQPTSMVTRIGSFAFFAVEASGAGVTYQWRKDGADIAGATGASYLISNVAAQDAGVYSVNVTNAGGTVTSDNASLTVQTTGVARLANLSTRAQVGTDGNILIPGFVVDRGASKNLLIRSVGPRLDDFHVANFLADPTMTLFNKNSVAVQSNDDWGQAPDQAAMEAARSAVFAFDLRPSTKDSSMLVNVPAGNYTLQTSGVGATTGVALVELYDTDPITSPARLVNISARAQVGTGGDILIPGFVIDGDVALPLLVRAVGPRLTDFNVAGVLADPVMTIYRGATPIAGNDNWGQYPDQAALAAATTATFAFPLNPNSADAAMLVVLPPGSYTVQVSGKNNTTGVALVELYLVGQ